MSERTMPGLGLRAFYEPGQDDWGQTVSEDLRKLSALVQLAVISRTTALPDPGAAGDIYIVPESAASNAGEIALWDGETGAEAWVFIQPQEGWEAWVVDEGARVRFDGAGWQGAVAVTTHDTSHSFALDDAGSILEATSETAMTFTIPGEAAVAFEVGTLIHVTQAGNGTLTVQAAVGVSLNGTAAGATDLHGRWSGAALYKRAPDAWVIQGGIGEVSG